MGSRRYIDLESQVKNEVKICIVGNPRVGKSALLRRFTQAHFDGDYIGTVGVDYDSRIIEHEGNYVKLHLYDISGQESFLWLAKKQINEADAFVLVYDVNDLSTFESCKRWLQLIMMCAARTDLPKILVGNKCDVRQQYEVSASMAKEFAIPENMQQINCSAQSGKNLSAIFYLMTTEILRYRQLGCGNNLGQRNNIVRLPEEPQIKAKLSEEKAHDYTHMFKILLLGAKRVGKTAYRLRFCDNHYSPDYYASSGLDFSTRILVIDNEKVKVQLWDVSGDDIYDATRKGYYKGANAFILMYDVNSQPSFEHAEKLLKELNMYGQSECPKVFVGNKCETGKHSVTGAQQSADGWRLPIVNVSTRTGYNIDEPIVKLIVALKTQLAPWKRVYDFSK